MLNKPAKVANLRTSHGDKPEDPRPAPPPILRGLAYALLR